MRYIVLHWKLSAVFKCIHPPLVPPSLLHILYIVKFPHAAAPTHALKWWFIISMQSTQPYSIISVCVLVPLTKLIHSGHNIRNCNKESITYKCINVLNVMSSTLLKRTHLFSRKSTKIQNSTSIVSLHSLYNSYLIIIKLESITIILNSYKTR